MSSRTDPEALTVRIRGLTVPYAVQHRIYAIILSFKADVCDSASDSLPVPEPLGLFLRLLDRAAGVQHKDSDSGGRPSL